MITERVAPEHRRVRPSKNMINKMGGETYLYIADAWLQTSISTVVEEIHVYLDVVEETLSSGLSRHGRGNYG